VLCFSFTLISAGDLALLLISLEGFSLTLYIMATINRLQGGIVGAVKYFTFGTGGSILIFWGCVHLYEITASLSTSSVFYVLDNFSEYFLLNTGIGLKLEWSVSIILIGFLIKLGAAPVHQWVPDVYAGVPLLVTSFFAIFIKFVLYLIFMKFAVHFNSGHELEYAALCSLIVGCFGTLRQVEIKRFLAYGSITHMGFLLTGDLVASIIYLLSYLIATFIFFSVLLLLRINGQELIYISDLRFITSSRQ
jgi:NADH-quinone oxidoreductase subunit N